MNEQQQTKHKKRGPKVGIDNKIRCYLDKRLCDVRGQSDIAQQLQDGAKLMEEILEMNGLFSVCYLELKDIIKLELKVR